MIKFVGNKTADKKEKHSSGLYSENIDKICALCRKSKPVSGSDTHLSCSVRDEFVPLRGTCGDFEYDIFKKPVRRRKKLKTDFSAEDFRL